MPRSVTSPPLFKQLCSISTGSLGVQHRFFMQAKLVKIFFSLLFTYTRRNIFQKVRYVLLFFFDLSHGVESRFVNLYLCLLQATMPLLYEYLVKLIGFIGHSALLYFCIDSFLWSLIAIDSGSYYLVTICVLYRLNATFYIPEFVVALAFNATFILCLTIVTYMSSIYFISRN